MTQAITVIGAGIVGLWQALTLARRGHRVRLVEQSAEPFARAASALGGAMIAPFCEGEAAATVIRELGLRSLALWRDTYPGLTADGTLVVTQARDRAELRRFASLTEGHEQVGEERLAVLEPDLAGRFVAGLYFAEEAHVAPTPAMAFLLEAARGAGAEIAFGTTWRQSDGDATVIDCRGLFAQADLTDLRGVRGERLIVRTREIALRRPVRLLHPRFPIYAVPWSDGLTMIGATQIESEDQGPVSVRSAFELLATAMALHPAFGEAEILEFGAAARPAFPDNLPGIIVRGAHIYVNGLFRHGFLLAPGLAALVADYLQTGARNEEIFRCESSSTASPR